MDNFENEIERTIDKTKWIEPSAAERERLYVVAEELMEAALEAGKLAMKNLRFGTSEVQPGRETRNIERLEEELGDLLGIVQVMIDAGDLSEVSIDEARARKIKKLRTYTKHQTLGSIEE